MARTFDGSLSKITANIAVLNGGNSATVESDWTVIAWGNPTTSGGGNAGFIVRFASGDRVFQFDGTTHNRMSAAQALATTNATAVSATNSFPFGVWQVFATTYTASEKKIRIYSGTLSAAVAEVSYTSQGVGVGTGPNDSSLTIGSTGAGSVWNGGLARVFLTGRLLSLAEMEAFRLGWQPEKDGSQRGYWPLDSPTASNVNDLFGVANGTATSLTVAEDPPVPPGLPDLGVF